jgi:hypothetical protein
LIAGSLPAFPEADRRHALDVLAAALQALPLGERAALCFPADATIKLNQELDQCAPLMPLAAAAAARRTGPCHGDSLAIHVLGPACRKTPHRAALTGRFLVRRNWKLLVLMTVATVLIVAWFEPTCVVRGWLRGEAFYVSSGLE